MSYIYKVVFGVDGMHNTADPTPVKVSLKDVLEAHKKTDIMVRGMNFDYIKDIRDDKLGKNVINYAAVRTPESFKSKMQRGVVVISTQPMTSEGVDESDADAELYIGGVDETSVKSVANILCDSWCEGEI